MEIVPKIEKDIPSTLNISGQLLPCIKEWEVGGQFIVKLSVKMVGKNQGNMFDPNDKDDLRASFEVMGAESQEIVEQPHKQDSKSAFVRALRNMINEME